MATALTTTLILASSWFTPTEETLVSGNIKYYNQDVMERVAVNRGYIDNTSLYREWLREYGVEGAVSLMRHGDIGRKAWLVVDGFSPIKVLVIDCVEKAHYLRRVVKQGDIAEVGWKLAKVFDMRGPIKGMIRFVSRPKRRAR